MNTIDMYNLGLDQTFEKEAAMYEGLFIGRVISQYKGLYKVALSCGQITAEVSGKLRFEAKNPTDFPAVGDFVMLDRYEDSSGNAIIHKVLRRKTAFIRKAPGTAQEEQVIGANIDTVFICMSLNKDFNLRRIERYLGVVWDSGAIPVVVLTKADLSTDIKQKVDEVHDVAFGVDVLSTSSVSYEGCKMIENYLNYGKTVAFIGSSGVGKSTLINMLIGKNVLATNEIRNDDKGRHTTTHRELYILPDHGMVIDTPGLREVGLETADLSRTFVDIDVLTRECKFSNCSHSNEPGCAVRKAIEEGLLTEDRLLSYFKLKKEVKYEGLNARQIENEKIMEMFRSFGGMKNARKYMKEKNKKV